MEEKRLTTVAQNDEIGIVVDDGRKAVPIRNSLGEEVGVFYFNPTDIGIIERFKKASEKFSYVVKPLNDLSDDASEDEQFGALAEAKTRLFTVCNELFGGNLAEAFFGSVEPFSPSDGKFYCENVLNAVSDYVSRQFDTETAKINARVQKYTKDYMPKTGKHKDGYR